MTPYSPLPAALFDTVTGSLVTVYSVSLSDWKWGSYSCDCGRRVFFDLPRAIGDCIGRRRYVVVGLESVVGLHIADLNVNYPPDVVKAAQERAIALLSPPCYSFPRGGNIAITA